MPFLMLAPVLMLACRGGPGSATGSAAPAAALSVENPALLRAIAARQPDRPIQLQVDLVLQLNAATYLLPLRVDPGSGPEPVNGGQTAPPAGARVQFLTITEEDDRPWLPLFTDAERMRAWTKHEVKPLVREASKAWTLALSGGPFTGVIINPGREAVRLDRATLQLLRRLSGGEAPETRDDP